MCTCDLFSPWISLIIQNSTFSLESNIAMFFSPPGSVRCTLLALSAPRRGGRSCRFFSSSAAVNLLLVHKVGAAPGLLPFFAAHSEKTTWGLIAFSEMESSLVSQEAYPGVSPVLLQPSGLLRSLRISECEPRMVWGDYGAVRALLTGIHK